MVSSVVEVLIPTFELKGWAKLVKLIFLSEGISFVHIREYHDFVKIGYKNINNISGTFGFIFMVLMFIKRNQNMYILFYFYANLRLVENITCWIASIRIITQLSLSLWNK